MSLIVRPCRLDECAQVLGLWRAAEAIPRPTDTLPDVERMVREHPDMLLVGEERGRLIGSVIAGWDGWRGGIYRLAVLPECRRRGVARALVTEAERRLAARGARRLSAMVARDEPQAVDFWNAAPGWSREPRWLATPRRFELPRSRRRLGPEAAAGVAGFALELEEQ